MSEGIRGGTRQVVLSWSGGLAVDGGEPGGPELRIDGDNTDAPGTVLTLLVAAAACSGADVVSILAKMRVELHRCRIEVLGERRAEQPRRFVAIHLVYHLSGAGLDLAKARRAVALSLDKYRSVSHSLAADTRITHELALD